MAPRKVRRGRESWVDSEKIAMIFAFSVLVGVAGYMILIPATSGWIGENLVYGVYVDNEKIGTLSMEITGTSIVENVEMYVARYSFVFGDSARAGELKFDMEGRLWRAVVAVAENDSLIWRTEIGYSFVDELMRVVVEDNRVSDNYVENDFLLYLTENIVAPEYIWYFFRFESLQRYYRREILINLLPDATYTVGAAFQVTGDETITTPAGNFDCWVLEGENTQLTAWPIDKLWVTKGGGLVVKGLETNDAIQYEYILESSK